MNLKYYGFAAILFSLTSASGADEGELSVSTHVEQVEYVVGDPPVGEAIPILNPSEEAVGGAVEKLAPSLSPTSATHPICNYSEGEVILLSAVFGESKCKYRYEYSDHADNESEGMLVKSQYFSCRGSQGGATGPRVLKTITHYTHIPESGVPFCEAGVR